MDQTLTSDVLYAILLGFPTNIVRSMAGQRNCLGLYPWTSTHIHTRQSKRKSFFLLSFFHLAVFKKEAANLHRMIRRARFSYENRLALASSKSPKPFVAYVRRKRELRQEIESIIVNGVEQTQPAVLSEAFRSYFSSTFRNDGGEDSPLNYPANNHMQHFIISAEDVHWQ